MSNFYELLDKQTKELKERMLKYMLERDISPFQFSREVGIGDQTIMRMLDRPHGSKPKTRQKIRKFLDAQSSATTPVAE